MQGLSISVTGLLVTFIALGLFILIMFGLQRIFPPRKKEAGERVELAEAMRPKEISEEAGELETVAAMAVAICLAKQRSDSSLGANLLTGPGRWWSVHQMNSNPIRRLKKG